MIIVNLNNRANLYSKDGLEKLINSYSGTIEYFNENNKTIDFDRMKISDKKEVLKKITSEPINLIYIREYQKKYVICAKDKVRHTEMYLIELYKC